MNIKIIFQLRPAQKGIEKIKGLVDILEKRWLICSDEKLELDIDSMKNLVKQDVDAWFWKAMLGLAEMEQKNRHDRRQANRVKV